MLAVHKLKVASSCSTCPRTLCMMYLLGSLVSYDYFFVLLASVFLSRFHMTGYSSHCFLLGTVCDVGSVIINVKLAVPQSINEVCFS